MLVYTQNHPLICICKYLFFQIIMEIQMLTMVNNFVKSYKNTNQAVQLVAEALGTILIVMMILTIVKNWVIQA